VFFVLSKTVFALIAPSSLCLLLIGCGVLLGVLQRWRRFGRRLTVCGFTLLLTFGFSPLAKWIVKPLDDRFAAVTLPAEKTVTHIILLGGLEQASIGYGRGQISTNSSGERILAIPPLARRYPKAQIVFSGGHGSLFGDRLDALNAKRGVRISG